MIDQRNDDAPVGSGFLKIQRAETIGARPINTLTEGERLMVVQSAHGKEKLDLLIEAVDGPYLLRRLPMQEVYLLVRQLGAEDTVELMELCQTEQLVGLLDLDGWQGYHLDRKKTLEWMFNLLECGEEKVLRTADEMDFELLSLVMQKHLKVIRGPEAIDDEDERAEALIKDGGYSVEFTDEPTAKIAGAWLDILFRHHQGLYLQLMEGVRWESSAVLEENVARWRNGRLLDQGFPEPLEARGVYSWLDPASCNVEQHRKLNPFDVLDGVEAPSYVLSRIDHVHLLAEVLARGITSEVAWELAYLLNKVMMADQVDIGEIDQVEDCVERVYGILDIALEKLCGHNAEMAADLFDSIWLESLFRLGHSLTLQLQHRAHAIHASVISAFLDPPYRSLVDALLQRSPQFYQGLMEVNRNDTHPFMTLEQVQLCSVWLDRLERQQRLFVGIFEFGLQHPDAYDLEGCLPEQGDDLSLSQMFLTAYANRLLGKPFAPEPLRQDAIRQLHRLVTVDGGGLKAEIRQECVAWLESLETGAGEFGAWCLASWDDEFCRLAAEELDPRFINGMMVRLD